MISLDNLKTVLNAIKCFLNGYAKKKDIPTKLSNPNPLTFTGAAIGSYDGSQPLTVEIPSGGGGGSVPKPLTYDYMPEGYPTKTMETVTVMEEQELQFNVDEFGGSATLPNPIEIVGGKTYTVNWDGTEYECVGLDVHEGNDDFTVLGNLSIADNFDDTGEPFLYISIEGSISTYDTSASHTISIKTIREVITPIAYNFMPAGYPTKSGQNRTLIEEQELAFATTNSTIYFANLPSTLDIVEGKTYTVNWDGTEYKCVGAVFDSRHILGNLSILGMGDDTGEPFLCVPAEGRVGTLDTSATHTISVTELEAITPIDEKYLPTIPADKLPTIPVIEFTTRISDSIANDAQPSFTVSNLSYSEIYALVEKGNFQIKDSGGVNYRPICCEIGSSGDIAVSILVFTSTGAIYAQLVCTANQTMFYRNLWWQIQATKK